MGPLVAAERSFYSERINLDTIHLPGKWLVYRLELKGRRSQVLNRLKLGHQLPAAHNQLFGYCRDVALTSYLAVLPYM